MNAPKTPIRVVAALAAWAPWLSPGPSIAEAEHPTLVSVESAQCETCHDDVIDGRQVIHAPVQDDCANCHEFSRSESGMLVQLVEDEPALCVMCHSELEKALALELVSSHPALEGSCRDCHEVHASEHPKLLHLPVGELCGMCHELGDINELHGGQLAEGTHCSSCHSPHGSDNPRMLAASRQHPPFAEGSCTACHREPFGGRVRLRARGEGLCTACHGDFPTPQGGGSVHAALEGEKGKAGCISCHDPHMSNHANFLLAEGPGLCSRCHGDVVTAASSPTGHAAADDCLNCHQPHTSQQEHLLTEPQDLLCALCHDLQDPALTTAHLGAELTELECTLCHTPHGAGHPSLLQTNLHPPVEDGCDICHEGRFDELAESGTADLCLMCHDEIGELASAAAVPHGAMEMDDCTICHNPHASAQRSLVKLPGGEECADCHDDKLPAAEEFGHGAIELIGCEACHEPHGGERPALLRRSDDGLCLSCHGPRGVSADSQQVVLMDRFEVPGSAAAKMPALRLSADGLSGHPVLGHRVRGQPTEKEIKASGTSFTGELSCLTCHDPHKGRSQGLFQWDARSPMEVCQQCHDR